MKHRITGILLALFLAAALAGCESYPKTDRQGQAWDRNWTILGRVLGVEDPAGGFVLSENPVVLTGSETFYAAWTLGEPSVFVNEDGEETDLYEAQIYLIVRGCEDHAAAEETIMDWQEREDDTYAVTGTSSLEAAGLPWYCLSYTVASETNPYARGASAFGVYERYAVCAEVTATESYSGDPDAVLQDFLAGFHFSAD